MSFPKFFGFGCTRIFATSAKLELNRWHTLRGEFSAILNMHGPSHHDHNREEFPGFLAAPTVDVGGQLCSAQLGLKTSGLDVFFEDGQNLHFDLEGRLVRVATPNVQWRRGLSGRTIELRKRSRDAGGGFARRMLKGAEIDRLIDAACERMCKVRRAQLAGRVHFKLRPIEDPEVVNRLLAVVERAARFDARAAARDLENFRRIYDDVPVLPPDQYGALVLMSTEGCRYNRCSFCDLYRGARYREKSLDEFQRHIEAATAYHGDGLTQRRGIFLGQANALMGDPVWRKEVFRTVARCFELPDPGQDSVSPDWWLGSLTRLTGVSSFLDAFPDVGITGAEFSELRELNLRHVFIGMETGNADLLKWLRKPATVERLMDTVHAAKSGGVQVGVIVLLGIGGEKFFDAHVTDTLELLRRMPLSRGDFVYLSPLVQNADGDYVRRAQKDQIEPLTDDRMKKQEALIRAGLQQMKADRKIYVARYDIENFVY